MYCICCSNIISWRKVPTHELQLLYSRCQRGEKNNGSSLHWGLMSLLLQIRKDDTHGGRFSSLTFWPEAWGESRSKHIQSMPLVSVQFTHGCFRILNWNFFGILITLSRDTGHNSDTPSSGWSGWTAFHFPLPKKEEMSSRPVIDFFCSNKFA